MSLQPWFDFRGSWPREHPCMLVLSSVARRWFLNPVTAVDSCDIDSNPLFHRLQKLLPCRHAHHQLPLSIGFAMSANQCRLPSASQHTSRTRRARIIFVCPSRHYCQSIAHHLCEKARILLSPCVPSSRLLSHLLAAAAALSTLSLGIAIGRFMDTPCPCDLAATVQRETAATR